MDNAYRKFYILFFTFIYFDYAAYLFIQFFQFCWSLSVACMPVMMMKKSFTKFDTITTCDAGLNSQVCTEQNKYKDSSLKN